MFVACVVAAAFSSGPGYLLEVALAGNPTDFTRDFVAAHWISDGKPLTALDGVAGNAEAVRLGGDPVRIPCGAFHLHPPPASILVRALVPFGFRRAAIVWLLISIAALAVLARVLLALWRPPGAPVSPREAGGAALVLAAWPPTVMNLAYGQWSLLLATLVAVGWLCLERGRPRSAVAALTAAVALKSTPGTILGYLIFARRRDRVRVLVVVLGLLVAIAALTWPFVGGLPAWRAFLTEGRPTVVCWEAFVDNTVSVNGILARLLVGGSLILAPFHAPGLAHVLAPAAAATLLAIAAAVTWRSAKICENARDDASDAVRDRTRDGAAFAMWATLTALLNPLSWTHNALFFLLPAALIARNAAARPSIRIATAVAIVALSVPRATLFLWSGPLPFAASRAWVLGLHAAAGLTLFACAAIQALGERSKQNLASLNDRPGRL